MNHPANEVCGDPWERAKLVTTREIWDPYDRGILFAAPGDTAVVVYVDGFLHLHVDGDVRHIEGFDFSDWVLDLSDPLSFAGLKIRLTSRLGLDSVDQADKVIRLMPYIPDYMQDGSFKAIVSWLASYFSLIDQVCKKFDVFLGPSEAPSIERHPRGYWYMRTNRSTMFLGHAGLDTIDTLTALRQAVKA